MARRLTPSEIQFLRPIYKNTLRYESIKIDENTRDVGGKSNSITPAGVPHFSTEKYCPDFTMASKALAQYVFVHEMMHVWQWGHGIYPIFGAIPTWLQGGGNYMQGYYYDLVAGKGLTDYNMEQQAAIVGDYWALLSGKMLPLFAKNTNAVSGDYDLLMAQLWSSGPSQSKF